MIVVTGATGFVGSHALRRLVSEDGPVRGLTRHPTECAGAENAVGDLGDPASLRKALEGADTVVHAAAITANVKEPRPGAYDTVNRVGTENLVAAAKSAGVKRFVLVSGLGTTRAPAGTYMATRWGMEEAVRRSGLEYVILQPSVLFGDGAEFVTALANLARRSPVVPVIGRPDLRFQPLWIEDLVTCIVLSTRPEAPVGEALPLGGADVLTFKELIEVICQALGKRRLLLPLPLPVARAQAAVMTALLPQPPLTPASIELFGFDNATDPDAVSRRFHFRARGFREHLLAHGVTG